MFVVILIIKNMLHSWAKTGEQLQGVILWMI